DVKNAFNTASWDMILDALKTATTSSFNERHKVCHPLRCANMGKRDGNAELQPGHLRDLQTERDQSPLRIQNSL
ncbi:hypothetical protein AWZ03_015304, partial [Drosophila navojoa]